MKKLFLMTVCFLSSTYSLAGVSGSDVAADRLSVSYYVDGRTITSVISLGAENGYQVGCSGLIFGQNTTADLMVYIGAGKDLKNIDLTSGQTVSRMKKMSSVECTRLQVALASATTSSPVSIVIKDQNFFSITPQY